MEIVAEPFRLEADGMLPIPTTPGLGIAWNPDGLARLSGGTYRPQGGENLAFRPC